MIGFVLLIAIDLVYSQSSWDNIVTQLEGSSITNGAVMLGLEDGRRWSTVKGNFNLDGGILVASASKWVTSTVFSYLFELKLMSLNDKVCDWIPWWTNSTGDLRSLITLEMLLSFRSALNSPDDDCIGNNTYTLDDCAKLIYSKGVNNTPGTIFHYGGSHMFIASVMALQATHNSTWNSVFAWALKRNTQYPFLSFDKTLGLGISQSLFGGQSNQNPAGGLYTSTNVYGDYLWGLLTRQVVPDYLDLMETDHFGSTTTIEYTPVYPYAWRYGLGLWLECNATKWSQACADRTPDRVSSPGKFGFYPWVDRTLKYWGIVATQNMVTPLAYLISVNLGYAMQKDIEQFIIEMKANTSIVPVPNALTPSPDPPSSPSSTPSSNPPPSPSSNPSSNPPPSPSSTPSSNPPSSPSSTPSSNPPSGPPSTPPSHSNGISNGWMPLVLIVGLLFLS